jgi:predicted transcriptional regulator
MDDEFDLMAELAKATAEAKLASASTAAEQLALVKEKALELANSPDVAERDATILLRSYCDQLQLPVKDDELDRLLLAADQQLQPATCYRKGERLQAEDPSFLVDDLIRLGSSNIIVGQPKVGKSSFVCGLIKALHHRQESFLGQTTLLPQHAMPVLVFGTDQQESDWIYFLRREGLISEGKDLLDPLEFFCSVDGQSAYNFTRGGVSKIKAEVQRHQFPLVILDSLSSMMEPTGLDENLSQYAAPIRHALSELTSVGATVVVLHHTTKRVASWDWVEECRGSSSITSVFGWGVLARWVAPEAAEASRSDFRVAFVGKGRGKGSNGGAMGRYTDNGWEALAGLAKAQAMEAARLKEVELSNVRALVFDQVTNYHRMGRDANAAEIATAVEKREQNVARELRKLVILGLVIVTREEPTGSRPRRYYALSEHAAAIDSGEDGLQPVREGQNGSLDSFPYKSEESIPLSTGREGEKNPSLSSGTPVERLTGDEWKNGWVVVDGSNPHAVTIAKLGQPLYRIQNMRWGVDLRACDGSPWASAHMPPEALPTTIDTDWL